MDAAIQSAGDMAMAQAVGPAALKKLGRGGNVDRAAQDFEAMFMTQMLQPMFDGLGNDPMFGGGHGEKVMRTFLLQEYGKIIAKGGHLGLADVVKKEMIKAQGQPAPAPSPSTQEVSHALAP
ncbi:MAG: rod-binding protein [Alphaproteobacteria bacterium]|nr:rod-binding protein [Alphaproteobacteria bacterium]